MHPDGSSRPLQERQREAASNGPTFTRTGSIRPRAHRGHPRTPRLRRATRPSAHIARPSAFPPKGMGATSGGGHGERATWPSAHSHTKGRRWRGGTGKAPTARRVTPGGLVRRNRPIRFPHLACGKSAHPFRRKATGHARRGAREGMGGWGCRSYFWGDISNWCTDTPARRCEHNANTTRAHAY